MISSKHVLLLTSLVALLFVAGIPAYAEAASYNLTADKETFVIGDTFTVDIKIESSDVGVNAAQATLSFPKDIVQVTGIDKSSSAFDFWLQGPSYSNDTGEVSFIGGSQSGISGKALEVLRVTFKVKGSGEAGFIFSDGAVTASDGSGTNVLTAMNGIRLTSITKQDATLIKPPQIVRPVVSAASLPVKPAVVVPLYPDPVAWYGEVSKFIVQWDLPRDVTEVATDINQQPTFDPTVSEGLFNNKTFSPLAGDGIWYLHVRFKNSVGWGPAVHYRIGIDSAPPLSFAVTSLDGLTTADVAPTILFETKDQPSGVKNYTVLVNGVVATTTTLAMYTLSPQPSGKQSIVVQAVDYAGNTTESRITLRILETPLITIAGIRVTEFAFFMSLIFVLVAGGVAGWYLGHMEREKRVRRLIIAQRDVQTSFGVIEKDINKLLVRMNDTAPSSEQSENEMKTILTRILDTLSKNTKYIVQNMQEIDS
ncbi:MAG: cohesin domain-containing protein [Minisyncoccia bacterium]